MKTKSCCYIAIAVLAIVLAPAACAQIFRVEQMNADQIRTLDRQKTVVIIPGGILEEHGPYLPAFTDGFMSQRLTGELASAIAARPGWKALIFPLIPLGTEGFNWVGGKASFPGTYAVRSATLRAVYMDLASELGEQGFRWIMIVHIHGAGLHNRALDQASDFFHDTYKGQMVHLWGLIPVLQAWGRVLNGLSEAEKREEGVSLHAGMDETSLMLYLQQAFVSPAYRSAPVHTGQTLKATVEVAKSPEWLGYLGSPRLGNAARGEKIWKALSAAFIQHALQILDGADPKKFARYGDALTRVPAYVEMDQAASAREKAIEDKQAAWLKATAAK